MIMMKINQQVQVNQIEKSLEFGQINLMDILSGSREHIKFLKQNDDSNIFNFSIPSLGYEGYFLFENNSSNLKKIFLNAGLEQTITIEILEIEVLDNYSPKIDLENFEIIDLRG